jgi:hypothetical protein
MLSGPSSIQRKGLLYQEGDEKDSLFVYVHNLASWYFGRDNQRAGIGDDNPKRRAGENTNESNISGSCNALFVLTSGVDLANSIFLHLINNSIGQIKRHGSCS